MSKVTEGIAPYIVHGEVLPDVIVGIAVVLFRVKGILRLDYIRVDPRRVRAKENC